MKTIDIKENKKIENTIGIDDILCVSYFLTQGVKLIDIFEDYPRHFTFILSNPQRCQDLKREYLNGAAAPARELFSQREMLISEIKSRNKNGNNYANTK